MVHISDEGWKQIGLDLMNGLTPCDVAFKYNMQERTIIEAKKRFATTGCILPRKPGVKKASKFQHRRKTTAAKDKGVKKYVVKHRTGQRKDQTLTSKMIKVGLQLNVHISQISRRIKEQGGRAYRPLRKEDYTQGEMDKRLAHSQSLVDLTPDQWMRCSMVDEHDTVHSNGRTGSRQLQSKKTHVYAFDGESRLQPGMTAPKRGKNTRGGTAIKYTTAILNGKVLVNKTCQSYIDGTQHLIKKPKPTLSKNGKRLGRPPMAKKSKKRGYDSLAHSHFLKDVAAAARVELGRANGSYIALLQDGLNLHWAPEAKEVIRTHKILAIDSHPTYSPDMNGIEEVFAHGEEEMQKITHAKGLASTPEETKERWEAAVKAVETNGTIKKIMRHMPDVFAECIANSGGPTSY